jgi:uncharacterized membrane protein
MSFFKYLILWIATLIFTSLIDVVWHVGIWGKAYKEGIKPLARMNGGKFAFNAIAGLLAQVLVVTSIVFLVLFKSSGYSLLNAAVIGAVAGVLAITVYGLTNYSLFKDWSLKLTVLEVIWGPFLGGFTGIFAAWFKSIISS